MNEDKFDKMSLPKDSENENLETRSRLAFAQLFPAQLFELRDELQRDKGVDYFVELKRKGSYTNFRFAVQLKATNDASLNNDGSFSFSLEISNINYLMNHNMPAYYIIYKARTGIFLFVDVYAVYREIGNKYGDQELPKTFNYRFENKLDDIAIKRLYDDTFERGLLFRNINPLLQMNLQQNLSLGSVVIDENRNVYTTTEKVAYLEKFGFHLLNAAKFKEVIEFEQQCYPLPKVTGSFHFVVGMAYYHQANMYRAIDHFKKAATMTGDLHPEMNVMLGYHTSMAKFALGLLTRSEINDVIAKYKNSPYVGLYLRITDAYVEYVKGKNIEQQKYELFYHTLKQIKADPYCDANIRLLADVQALQVEGQRLNNKLCEELMFNRTSPIRELLQDSHALDQDIADYNSKVQALQKRAEVENNRLTYLVLCLNSLKINYSAIAMTYCIRNFDQKTMTSKYTLQPEALAWVEDRNGFLDEAADFYSEQGFLENMVVALSLKYEILLFIGDSEAAEITKERMSSILDANDLKEYQRKFKHLTNGGTVHEITLAMLVETFQMVAVDKPEADELQREIEAFEAEEKRRGRKSFTDEMNIDVYPLGWFAFPSAAFEDVMDALHVEGDVREKFRWMLKEGVMAQVNVLCDPVISEGHGAFMAAHRGIQSQRNLHRIRKYFLNHGYPRLRG